jgi:hypothetical protein
MIQIIRQGNNISRIVIGVLLFAVALFVFLLILGVYENDFFGYTAMGSLVLAFLFNLNVCLSYFAKDNVLNVTKWAWVSLSVAVLVFVVTLLVMRHGGSLEGAGAAIGYPMIILAFPSSFIFVDFYSMLSHLVIVSQMPIYADISLVWLGCFVIGYLQWFVLIPFLIRRMRKDGSSGP